MGGAERRISGDLLPFINEDQLQHTESYTHSFMMADI